MIPSSVMAKTQDPMFAWQTNEGNQARSGQNIEELKQDSLQQGSYMSPGGTKKITSFVGGDSGNHLSSKTEPDRSLESIFQDQDVDDINKHGSSRDDALKQNEVLREDLEKAGLLSGGLSNKQANVMNTKAFRELQMAENPPHLQGTGELSHPAKQYNSQHYDGKGNGQSDVNMLRSEIPYDSENDYGDDERDWIIDELANAGTGSQVPQDDFVWSDTAENLMMASAERKSPTLPPLTTYTTTEAALRDGLLSNQNNENIMVMTSPSYISTTTPSQSRTNVLQGTNWREPDYLMPDFGTDSSGQFLNENGVSGNYGDIGDEVDFEILQNVKKSKVPKPTDASDKNRLGAIKSYSSYGGTI